MKGSGGQRAQCPCPRPYLIPVEPGSPPPPPAVWAAQAGSPLPSAAILAVTGRGRRAATRDRGGAGAGRHPPSPAAPEGEAAVPRRPPGPF